MKPAKSWKNLIPIRNKKPETVDSELEILIGQTRSELRTALDLRHQLVDSELPKSISSLTSFLTTLILSDNELEQLPGVLVSFVNLRSLDISQNKLTEFPNSVLRLPALVELNISNNLISSIPDSIVLMKHLERLDVSRNRLTKLSVKIVELSNLVVLKVSGNEITALPAEFLSMPKLGQLDLTANPMKTPPKTVIEAGLFAMKEYFVQNGSKVVDVKKLSQAKGDGPVRHGAPAEEPFQPDLDDALASLTKLKTDTSNLTFQLIKSDPRKFTDDLNNVFSSISGLLSSRKMFVDLRHGALDKESDKALTNKSTYENLAFYFEHQRQLQSVDVQLAQAIQLENIESAKESMQQRNRLRINFARELNQFAEKYIGSKTKEEESGRQDDLELLGKFEQVNTALYEQIKKTNELARKLQKSIMAEQALIEKNRIIIEKGFNYYNGSKQRRDAPLPKNIEYFLTMIISDVTKTVTPMQLNNMIKRFMDFIKAEKESKLQIAQKADPLIRTVENALKYEILLGYRIQSLIRLSYPEAILFHDGLSDALESKLTWPWLNYRKNDYHELILAERGGSRYIGVNPYGHSCTLRKFPFSDSLLNRLESVAKQLCRIDHRNIGRVHGYWYENDEVYVEQKIYQGKTLKEYLTSNYHSLSFIQFREIIRQLLSALSTLHRMNIFWGPMPVENIIASPNYDHTISPILIEYDFLLENNQIADSILPELISAKYKANSASADLYHFGRLILNILSIESLSGSLLASKVDSILSAASLNLISRNFPPFLRTLLQTHPDNRLTANSLLLHPFFLTDTMPEKMDHIKELEKYALHLCNYRRQHFGVANCEMDLETPFDEQFTTILESMQGEEFYQNLIFTPIKSQPNLDLPTLTFQQFVQSDLFVRVGSEFPGLQKTSLFMPNPSIHDTQALISIARVLAKYAIEGLGWLPVFPMIFYKLLLCAQVTTEDLELIYPKEALELNSLNVPPNDILGDYVESMSIISKSFLEFLQCFFGLSVWDLIQMIQPCTRLSSEIILKTLRFSEFAEDSSTPALLKQWLGNNDESYLRKFYIFATSLHEIPINVSEELSGAHYLIDSDTPLEIYIHGKQLEESSFSRQTNVIERLFVNNLYISSDFHDFDSFQREMNDTIDTWLKSQYIML